MARIAGVDIPNEKRIVISLTYIYGIGLSTSKKILAACGISEDTRTKNLTEDELRERIQFFKENALRYGIPMSNIYGETIIETESMYLFKYYMMCDPKQ